MSDMDLKKNVEKKWGSFSILEGFFKLKALERYDVLIEGQHSHYMSTRSDSATEKESSKKLNALREERKVFLDRVGKGFFKGSDLDVSKELNSCTDINKKGKGGYTLLMLAVRAGCFVEEVLACNPDISIKNDDGETAVGIAQKYSKNRVVDILRAIDPSVIIFKGELAYQPIQESFDFTQKKKLTVLFNADTAVFHSIDDFALIQNDSKLRKAFDEHVKRGGKTPENEVFVTGRLSKKRLSLKK